MAGRCCRSFECSTGNDQSSCGKMKLGCGRHSQWEGGEQGDPLMPLLSSLAQHAALVATQEQLRPGEFLFAFLDDIYVVCLLDRVGDIDAILQEELYRHARISIHLWKRKVWNSGGEEPEACATLQVAARNVDPTATVWRGDPTVPVALQGVKILGTPVGHEAFVVTNWRRRPQPTLSFWTGSRPSRTYKQFGFSSCSALQRKPSSC